MDHFAPLIDQYLSFWPTVLTADLVRYLIGAGGVFLTIWLLLRRPLASRKIRAEMPFTRQMWSEFGHSMSTVAIFASVGTGIALGKLHGVLPIYTDVAEYGWPYFFASLLLMIVAHDAYFYWAHRLMHRWRWLWRLHATHHRSHNRTPWAAYSFDPGEAIIHAMFMPVFIALIPMHVVALFLFTAHMMLRNAMGQAATNSARADGQGIQFLSSLRQQLTTTCTMSMGREILASISRGGIAGWGPSISISTAGLTK